MNAYPKTRKERAGTLTAAILKIARTPAGYVFTDELEGFSNTDRVKLRRAIENLVTVRKIHRLQIAGTSSFRYFGNFEDRERLAQDQPERQPKAYQKRSGKIPTFTNQPKPPAGGPARLPGEPLITAATKVTYGRSPSNPTRTNTHSEAV
jgi:hypothetical protein